MDKNTTLRYIQGHQEAWADDNGIRYTPKSWVLTLSDNLFTPLNAATFAEYKAADGDELGRGGTRCKTWETYGQTGPMPKN